MEASTRLIIFLSIFAAMAIFEAFSQRHQRRQGRVVRWPVNLGLAVIDIGVQRLTLGAAAYGAAVYADVAGFGLFNMVAVPFWLEMLVALVLLDLAIWSQHVASHAIPWFWRLHRVHHADLDLDVTSGLRFHPGEILLSLVWKAAIVVLLGIDPWIVVIYEAALNAAALFTHANIVLPARLDAALRLIICTPDMHRIHHSVIRDETDSNYGNILSVWDRLFGTYRREARGGDAGIVLGLPDEQDATRLGLVRLIVWPFERR